LRLPPIDRQQMVLEVVDTDRLVGQDHAVRALWDLLGRLDLRKMTPQAATQDTCVWTPKKGTIGQACSPLDLLP
jgi:hypothetical protein